MYKSLACTGCANERLFFNILLRQTSVMRNLFIALLLAGCAHKQPDKPEEELVSINSALNHIQASYLKGCVDALKDIKVPLAFHGCRDKAFLHRQEVEQFIMQE